MPCRKGDEQDGCNRQPGPQEADKKTGWQDGKGLAARLGFFAIQILPRLLSEAGQREFNDRRKNFADRQNRRETPSFATSESFRLMLGGAISRQVG
ncbi:MAG TPA: hypothetical protein VHC22_16555 [Pirellulales bacterium]|nr:hypothetical protein [Pirellulales bacterium]